MATPSLVAFVRRIVGLTGPGDHSDRQLLDRFVRQRDEAAFDTLLRRHGPMILGVCRRVLGDPDAAEDAFQATFLVLVRKAAVIHWHDSVGPWLYGVAYRAALKARAEAARRRDHEREVKAMGRNNGGAGIARDWQQVIDEELSGLPAKYRAPLVLCYLEGKTNEEAARELGWRPGSMSRRLARGRDLLRGRLTRRGVSLAAGPAVASLLPDHSLATVPDSLANETLRAAAWMAAGNMGAEKASVQVLALVGSVLQTMGAARGARQLAALLLGGALAFGAGLTYWSLADASVTAPHPDLDGPAMTRTAYEDDESVSTWPMWGRSPRRNMVSPGQNPPTAWDVEAGDNIRWSARLGTRSYGGPVVADGRVFVATNNEAPRDPAVEGDKGIVMCFRQSDGQFFWQTVHDKLPNFIEDWPQAGICSTPAVEGERLYYVSNRCALVCVDTRGRPGTTASRTIWKLDMREELGVRPLSPHISLFASSPLVVGDLVFVVTLNGTGANPMYVPAPQAPSFIAVNKRTGKLVWKDASPGRNIMRGQWGSPAYGVAADQPQVILPGGDGWLYAFEPQTGKPLWRFDCNPKDSAYDKGTKNPLVATPVIAGNRCYVGVGRDPEFATGGVGHLWCIDLARATATGGDVSPELLTDAKAAPIKTKPNPASALAWHYGGAVRPQDRNQVPRDNYFGLTMSTVAVHDGLLYASEVDGYLHCLDANTGKNYWDHDLRAAIHGSPLWVDRKVYIASDEGDVWIFDHGRRKKEPRRIELGQPIHSTPVFADGVLYVMTESTLFAIQEKR
jgi:RNA polymerase sigma factor (sigma-70 family)